MLSPVKMVDIELSKPLPTFEGLDGYIAVKGLLRLHGVPIGYIQAPLTAGRCTDKTLSKLILEKHSKKIICQLLENGLATPPHSDGLRLEDLFDLQPPEYHGTLPLVTVAVCTRDRPADLDLCCEALNHLDYPHLDILIVDNAPSSDASERLLQEKYPHFRYVKEPRPGLDWARNRAIIESKGEIIAYTDDDVVVDTGWVRAFANLFVENPEVMAATGLVVPYELETEAQVLFEIYGGFGRGFDSNWHRIEPGKLVPWGILGTGQLGTGANMAYRRSLFDQIGYFDPALDVGTVTNGGGDLEMFFRVLKEGHTLVYEPKALIRHRHRRDYQKLRTQLTNNGSLFSYIVCACMVYPDQIGEFLRITFWCIRHWYIPRLIKAITRPTNFPADLVIAEIKGCFIGLTRYQKARKIAAEIANTFGSLPAAEPQEQPIKQQREIKREIGVAVRQVELSEPLQALTDIADYSQVRLFLKWKDRPLCSVDIPNCYESISKSRLIQIIIKQLGIKLLEPDSELSENERSNQVYSALALYYSQQSEKHDGTAAKPEALPLHIPVSVVVATLDRPDDLRNCLSGLFAQNSPRSVEIVVVDNNPGSGLTPPVVAEFPGTVLVTEPRKGLAYARNKGFTASTGDICLTTDDDVTIPSDWVEKLIAPFARADVMIVTGNVLPKELETTSQRFFESYGGLGRGFERFEANGEWLESFKYLPPRTYDLGATANAAFRATIFSDPEIGLMKEALGPGMPSGVGEDTYLFYKVLKAGYALVYEPAAYVWHKHRRDPEALRRQIYNYSKGHISYQLTTLFQDGDMRSLVRMGFELPWWYLHLIKERLLRRSDYSIPLVLLEASGNLAGPWSLWRSHQRVKREGRSEPYIPVSQRPNVALEQLSATANSQQLTVNS